MKIDGTCQLCHRDATHEYQGRYMCDLHYKRHGCSITLIVPPRKKKRVEKHQDQKFCSKCGAKITIKDRTKKEIFYDCCSLCLPKVLLEIKGKKICQ